MAEISGIEWTDATFNPWIGCTKVSPACDHCYAEVATPSRTLGVEWGTGKPRHRTSAANWRQPMQWNARPFGECIHCRWRGEVRQCKNVNNPAGFYPPVASAILCPRCMQPTIKESRRRVFCASLADVFDNAVDPAWRADLFALIEATPNLDWLLLTKRIGNVAKMASVSWLGGPVQHGPDPDNIHGGWPANVWLGATICNQAEADRDVPKLLRVPAAVRFLSIEPMLGPVDLTGYLWGRAKPCDGCPKDADCDCGFYSRGELTDEPSLGWVIAGGESGRDARWLRPNWARSLRDQCANARVPFLFKQWGEYLPDCQNPKMTEPRIPGGAICMGKKNAGRKLDGVTHDGYPEVCHA